METKTWQTSGGNQLIFLARSLSANSNNYNRVEKPAEQQPPEKRSKMHKFWRKLTRKVNKEKKKVLISCSSPAEQQPDPYDPVTYSKNFDQGCDYLAEPEDFNKSFSARYAAPSRRTVNMNNGWLIRYERDEKGGMVTSDYKFSSVNNT